jgi:hypothetical protein
MAKHEQSNSQFAPEHDGDDLSELQMDRGDPVHDPIDLGHCVTLGPAQYRPGGSDAPGEGQEERPFVDEQRTSRQGDEQYADEDGDQIEGGALPRCQGQAGGGHEGQREHGRDRRPDDGPDGEWIVGTEAPEPSEAVHDRHRVTSGQGIGEGLRRERHLE